MRYRRAILVVEPGADTRPAVATLRRAAPRLERLLVVGLDQAETRAFQALGASRWPAPRVDLISRPDLGGDGLVALAAEREADLIVFGARSLRSASWVSLHRPPVAVLWTGETAVDRPFRQVGCVALDGDARVTVGAFLRDHADPSMRVTLLSPTTIAPDAVSTALEVAGIEADVEVSTPGESPSLQQWIDAWTSERALDLVVFADVPTTFLVGRLWDAPILLLPPGAGRPFGERAIDVPDLLDLGTPLRLRIDRDATVGDLSPVADRSFTVVSAGRVVATLEVREGEAELAAGLELTSIGVCRAGDDASADPFLALEARAAVVRPGAGPLVAFDAELGEEALRALQRGTAAYEVLAVRLRPARSCRAIRERRREAGLAPVVVDARAVLDEGDALDVSEQADPVRLARVATELSRAGVPVLAIVHQGPVSPSVKGFAAWTPSSIELGETGLLGGIDHHAVAPPDDRAIGGNQIELELDNVTARGWLLDAIEGSVSTLHLQAYLAEDDDAGARIVTVRVLIDSLHGFHGSFGVTNPLLERLTARPGVEVRTGRPLHDLPSVTDLKLRDHRKVVIADGRIALVGGRNLAHAYYAGFEEVDLTPASPWRDVPWLDAGARVVGPAVAPLAAAFREAWTEAGGASFEVTEPPPAGSSAARVVVHHGLRDARALEAYRELVDGAASHVILANGFPLALELQRALLRALRRGVRVRALIGPAVPMHDGRPFGSWAPGRATATELVASRMDPLVAAGGEVHVFARRGVPGWSAELGVVHPHVHAKVMSVDGLRCAVGSANMDITSAYWESEVTLLVLDPEVVRGLEARLGGILAASDPVRRDDPRWQEAALRRRWMRRWPGVLSA